MFHVKRGLVSQPDVSRETSRHSGADDSRWFRQQGLPHCLDMHIVQSESTDDLIGRRDLSLGICALQEDELTSASHERRRQGDESSQRTDGARRHGIQSPGAVPLFRSGAHDLDVRQTQSTDLLCQPGNPTLHGLDEDPLDIRPRDREHQARKAGAGTDVAYSPREQRRGSSAVENVSRPQTRQLKGADQAAFLAVLGERSRVLARQVSARSEKSIDRSRRLRLDHGCFT